MNDNDPRLQRLQRLDKLACIENRLAHQRRDALGTYLDSIAGLDHDEPRTTEQERLHSRLVTISIEHDVALAKFTTELDARADDLAAQLVDEAENILRKA